MTKQPISFKTYYVIFTGIIVTILMNACSSAKKLSYFQDLENATVVNLPPMPQQQRVIETGDNLYISFSARDNQAASFFNKGGSAFVPSDATGSVGTSTTAGSANGSDYLVDNQGYLEFPIIGKVKVSGLTAEQAQQSLLKNVTPYLKEPLVELRFNTFRISVLGEVRTPGIHTLPLQRTTLFEALASAGDLPVTAQRYDINLYRDYNGQRKIYKIDLTKSDVLTNPEVFQIRHNDVIYVKPRANPILQQETAFVTSIMGLVLGVITLAATLYFNN